MRVARIDVVGCFGSTYSYASVGGAVARALREAGLLGRVSNIDDRWAPSFQDLCPAGDAERGTHVLLFVPPNHYFDTFAESYGQARAAIYVSPNTDRLANEHAETISKFGLTLVPSTWCLGVVQRALSRMDVAILPLGVESAFALGRVARVQRLRGRAMRQEPVEILHLSTDQWWPGRKGTEELIDAWGQLWEKNRVGSSVKLVLHVPPRLEPDVRYRLALAKLIPDGPPIEVLRTGARGSEESLVPLYDKADLVVLPSRCEGFGMMILAALAAGVPLVTTYQTGQADFLSACSGWLGAPCPSMAPIVGEEGSAPVVVPQILAGLLEVAMTPAARLIMLDAQLEVDDPEGDRPAWGTWAWALPRWIERLRQWTEETK